MIKLELVKPVTHDDIDITIARLEGLKNILAVIEASNEEPKPEITN